MIEYVYNNNILGEESYYVPYEIIQNIRLQESLKRFYLHRAYEARLEDNIIVYFVNGYTIDEQSEIFKKNDVSLMFVSDNEYNTARLYLYGNVFKDTFKYKDDISQTEVLKTTGLKIKKADSEVMSRDQIIMEEDFFKNKDVNAKISESKLVERFFMEYKINKAIENNEKFDIKGFLFEGSFEEGYKITEEDNTEYFIKPGEIPLDFEITVK